MFYSSREDEILDLLEKRNSVSVHFLSKELAVSEPTVRRALSSLEKRGKIKRTFGGAVLAELENRETPLSFRESEDMTAKKRDSRESRGTYKRRYGHFYGQFHDGGVPCGRAFKVQKPDGYNQQPATHASPCGGKYKDVLHGRIHA